MGTLVPQDEQSIYNHTDLLPDVQVQLLMASQFLPSIHTCSFEWLLVPTHPPQNNIYLISTAPGPSTFSTTETLLGRQSLALERRREKMIL